jgi:hypothetical protein
MVCDRSEMQKFNVHPELTFGVATVITDFNDKNFDLEAYLTKISAEN